MRLHPHGAGWLQRCAEPGRFGQQQAAIQGGLEASEILARTRGSLFWGGTYGLFVIAVSVHAAIGLRNILREWLQLRGIALAGLVWICFGGLLLAGLRAVFAVVS